MNIYMYELYKDRKMDPTFNVSKKSIATGQTWMPIVTQATTSAIDFSPLPSQADKAISISKFCSSYAKKISFKIEGEIAEEMAGEDEVKLLGFWASHFAMRVIIALEEKGIKYEFVEEDILFKKSPLLLEMNPIYKQVPVLIHNGRPLVDSAIILQYIDEVWSNGPTFLPSDPYDRAMARFWVDFIEKKFIIPGRLLMRAKGEEQEGGKRQVIESLEILEEVLKGKDYFGGMTFGMVDIAFAPAISFFSTYEAIGNFKIMSEDKFPSILGWAKKFMERESVKKALPEQERVLQFVMQFTKRSVSEA